MCTVDSVYLYAYEALKYSDPRKYRTNQCQYLISGKWLILVAVGETIMDSSAPSDRAQSLLDLRRSGTVTLREFAVLLKDLSTEELIGLSQQICSLSKPEIQ